MIVLDFYGEKETIENPPEDFNDLKKIIAEKFLLQKEDVDELIFYDGTQEIKNQNDYSTSIKKNGITIKIDISQNSKLYKITEENIKNENSKIENKKIENGGIENQNQKIEENKNKEIAIHNNVQCDGCKCKPIKGIRYKCTICPNFDYCEKCEKKYSEKHGHPFLKIRKPNQQNYPTHSNPNFPINNPFNFFPFCSPQFPNQRFPHHRFPFYGGPNHFC